MDARETPPAATVLAAWNALAKGDLPSVATVKKQISQGMVRAHQRRPLAEAHTRPARFRNGLKGLWDRLRGANAHMRALNEKGAAR